MENIWVKFTESIARGLRNVGGPQVRGLHNVHCYEMTPGLARWSSVSEGTHFRTETLTYLTYPKSYRSVEEDIWHWAPVTSQEVTSNTNRKHRLYLETLTFREVDNLSQILVDKLRSVEVREGGPGDSSHSRTIRKIDQSTRSSQSKMSSSYNGRVRRCSYHGTLGVRGNTSY